MSEKIIFAWSSGKDSALALHEILKADGYDVVALLTTVTEEYERVSMHGVRRELLERQADSIGLPLEIVWIPRDCSNGEYESRMRAALEKFIARGVRSVAFGDVFLEDVRRFREQNLAKAGMKGIFPLWRKESALLARAFIDGGFKAIVTCVDSKFLGKEFAGRIYDDEFLRDLPPSVDQCGENGEFHTFAFGGPIFRSEITFRKGEVVLRDERFYFADLI
jgi:uncharacterized protein (TIGR00290 family)